MIFEFPVVTICGSMRFREEMLRAAEKLSKQGYIVLAPFVTCLSDEEQASELKKNLDRMHFAKIDLSSEIFVVNPGGYVGESTRNEIDYAQRTGKLIRWRVPLPPAF